MRIYKQTYRDRKGKKQEAKRWYIAFTHNGIRCRFPVFTSRAATDTVAEKIEDMMAGRPDFKWLARIPTEMRDRLLNTLDPDDRRDYERQSDQKQKEQVPLIEHLKDYCAGLEADNRKPRYIGQTESEISSILTGCGFELWSDIDGNKVKVFLAKSRGSKGYGQRTYNSYLGSFKSFCVWLKKENRVGGANPMEYHKPIKQTEYRKKRRALTFEEIGRLLEATEAAPERYHMSGHERALAYRLTFETGLRANELRSLTISSFDFDIDPPAVHVDPADTKGKKPADLTFVETATAMKEFLGGKEPHDSAFNIPHSKDTARMIRADLKAAQIPYKDDSGRDLDFHSLRHTFITNLALAGVHPAVAQKLARHSKIELTMKYYTHVLHESEVAAIKKLHVLATACQNGTQTKAPIDGVRQKSLSIGPKTAKAG